MIFLPTMTTEIKMEILKPKVKKKKKVKYGITFIKTRVK